MDEWIDERMDGSMDGEEDDQEERNFRGVLHTTGCRLELFGP